MKRPGSHQLARTTGRTASQAARGRALLGLFTLFGFAATAGCGGAETAGYVRTTNFDNKTGNTKLVGYDATRRGQLIRLDDGGNLLDSCSEPPPDAIAALATKLALESAVAVKGPDTEFSGASKLSRETSQTVLALATKTSETLFLREILFRRCEARMNAKAMLKAAGKSGQIPTGDDSVKLRASLLDSLKEAQTDERRNQIASALQRIDADDAFFSAVMENYSGLARTGADANRIQLLRDVLAAVPKEDLQDAALLEALKEAVTSGNIVKVLEREAQLVKARTEKKAEEERKKNLAQCNEACVDKEKCNELCGSDSVCKLRCGSQPKCETYCDKKFPKN